MLTSGLQRLGLNTSVCSMLNNFLPLGCAGFGSQCYYIGYHIVGAVRLFLLSDYTDSYWH